jgi:capsular exopolysaccharide synthesis family protein
MESTGQPKPSLINIKRVLARAIRFWYVIILSVLATMAIAYVVNRYSTRVYQVNASIIIKQNEESAGAKFLYNNELVNPYRNFYNEIYIMKSYPLLQEVIEGLNFNASLYKEGDIKTTEYYDAQFPVAFKIESGKGRPVTFTITSETTYAISYKGMKDGEEENSFSNLPFDAPVKINGFTLIVRKKGDLKAYLSKPFLVTFQDTYQLAKTYSAKLNVSWAQAGASVVSLQVSGSVPNKEIDFLNRFIERYQIYDVEKKNKVSKMAMRFLDNQLLIIGDSLKRFEDQVEVFKRKNITTNLDQETSRLYQKLLGLEDQKFQYKLLENYFIYISDLLKTNQFEGIFTPSSVGINDNIVSQLIGQLIEQQAQVNLYKSNISKGVERTDDNPALQSKLQVISLIKKDILKTIDNSRQTQAISVRFINDQIKIVEQQLHKLPRTERELISIQRNYSLKESLYVFLLQKRTEAGLSEASTTSDIVVVNPPMAGSAISPKIWLNYAVAILIGLLLPLTLFVGAELLNTRIQSREDIESYSSVPIIAGVGHNPQSNPLVIVEKPKSAMAESFRALRSNLSYFIENKDKQVVMITSSIPSEGKSFTTLNLAAAFAMAGKKTLIIGADLRKPKLYGELQLNNDRGLSQYLSSLASLESVIQTSFVENLYFISGGAVPPNPSELLLKPAMAEMLTLLKAQFDFIILDTPPLGLVTDAFVLAPLVNHTLFVVRQDYTPRAVLQSLEEYYQTGKMTNISILFNDLRKSGLGYGYGNYGYNYGYGYGVTKKNGKNKNEESYYSD